MSAPQPEQDWDPDAQKTRWCTSVKHALEFQEKLDEGVQTPLSGFFLLCLAELDAGLQMVQSGCFSTRASFVAEVRRLMSEPTAPSRPVYSLEAYRNAQKWWLVSIVTQCEWEAKNPQTPGSA